MMARAARKIFSDEGTRLPSSAADEHVIEAVAIHVGLGDAGWGAEPASSLVLRELPDLARHSVAGGREVEDLGDSAAVESGRA